MLEVDEFDEVDEVDKTHKVKDNTEVRRGRILVNEVDEVG